MGLRWNLVLALSAGLIFSQSYAAGRFSPTEASSHPKTKGVPPIPGDPAPTTPMTDTTGRRFNLSDYHGKIVVLEWTNFECPYVSRHYSSGSMQATQARALANGVVWLNIFSSAPGKQGYQDARGADYFTTQKGGRPTAIVLDPSGTVGRAFGARTTPHMFVINQSGRIAYAGAIDDQPRAILRPGTIARNYVNEAIDSVKAGHQPAVRATAAYGCSVKY